VEFLVPKWLEIDLFYNISKYPKSLEQLGGSDEIDNEIEKAFGVWSNVTEFNFTRALEGWVDIDIRFEDGKQWDDDELRNIKGSEDLGKVVAYTRKV